MKIEFEQKFRVHRMEIWLKVWAATNSNSTRTVTGRPDTTSYTSNKSSRANTSGSGLANISRVNYGWICLVSHRLVVSRFPSFCYLFLAKLNGASPLSRYLLAYSLQQSNLNLDIPSHPKACALCPARSARQRNTWRASNAAGIASIALNIRFVIMFPSISTMMTQHLNVRTIDIRRKIFFFLARKNRKIRYYYSFIDATSHATRLISFYRYLIKKIPLEILFSILYDKSRVILLKKYFLAIERNLRIYFSFSSWFEKCLFADRYLTRHGRSLFKFTETEASL